MRSRSRSRLRAIASVGTLLVVSVFLVAACASKNEPSAEEANATLCKAKTDLQSTIDSVGNLDPGSATVDGLKTVRSNVREAFDEVNKAAAVVAEQEIQDLRKAKDDFLRAVQSVDDLASLKAAAPEIKSTAAAVRAAFQALFAAADCT